VMLGWGGSLLTAGGVTTEYDWSPSTIGSSTPVTVTVCGTFQFAAFNVMLAGDTAPSVASLLVRPITTSASGWLCSAIVNVAFAPDSSVLRPPTALTTMPAWSSSAFVAATSAASMPAYTGSLLTAAPVTMR